MKLPRAVLTKRQVEKLFEAPSSVSPLGKRNRAILETFYGTGIRVSECAALELRDLDLAKGTLMVRSGKGSKDRMVPVTGRAAAALDLYLREGRPEFAKDPRERALFLSYNGKAMNRSALEVMVREAGEAAGLKVRVSPHVLRHRLRRHNPGHLLLLWDQGQPHRHQVVRAYLARHRHWHPLWLPGYAPELNPQERVWSYLSTGAWRTSLQTPPPRFLARSVERLGVPNFTHISSTASSSTPSSLFVSPIRTLVTQ